MQNLIKIQEELKNVPLQAVMAYVNGRNPMVPPYLALTELNRRKQIQQSAQAQSQPQPTVKDQVQQQAIQQQAGIMALQNQRAQAGAQNMAQTAGQTPQPGAVPPNAPVQGEPAMPPVVKAAFGGLMQDGGSSQPRNMFATQGLAQIPTPAMFQQRNFAGGGIVAFAGENGSEVVDEELSDEAKKELEKIRARNESVKSGLSELIKLENWNPLNSAMRAYKQFVADPINRAVNKSPEEQRLEWEKAKAVREGNRGIISTDAQIASDKAKADEVKALVQQRKADELKAIAEKNAPPVPADAAATPVTTTTATAKPPVSVKPPVSPIAAPVKDIYSEEADKLQKLRERFGVKENITSESDRMLAEIKKNIAEQRGQQGLEALGEAMAEGAKGDRWYEASANFGKGYFGATARQRELNNKQDEAFLNYQVAREKEDDARRRGNVKDVVEAADKTQKLKIDMINAEANRIQAMKPSQLAEQVQLYSKNPELFNRLYPKENPLVISAAKAYFEKIATGLDKKFIEQYPTVNDYVAATVAGGGYAAGAGDKTATGPKEGDKSTSKSGKPIVYKNGKWEYI